jgi:LysM repeat protein
MGIRHLVIASILLGLVPTTPSLAQACPERLGVRFGDTLSDIARRCGTSVDRIRAANPGLRPDNLRAGSRIAVPAAGLPSPQRQIGRPLIPRSPSAAGSGISGTVEINRPRTFAQPPVAGPILAPPPIGMLAPGEFPNPHDPNRRF